MAPDKVREALRVLPFRPFVVELAGGKRVPVKHPDYAQLSPAGRTLIVFTNDDDAMEIIDVFLISNLSYLTKGAKQARAQVMPYEFKLTRRIEFAETDMAGIVHFSNFFRMMETTEHAFFRSLGFSIHSHDEGGTTGWPRVGASCEYLRPLRFEEEVEIHLLIAEVRNRSVRYQFVFRKSDGREVARGTIATVCASVDKISGKLMPVLIPERIRAKIEAAPTELLGKSRVEG